MITHLWVEVVDTRDGLADVAPLQRFADIHPALNTIQIHWRVDPGLAAELLCGGLEALDDEVVHDEPI